MSNLSHQFDDADHIEDVQRRRFARRHEPGYVGNGYWYANYPYMIGALGSGTLPATPPMAVAQVDGYNTEGTAVGMGEGGTAAYATGMAGGGMP